MTDDQNDGQERAVVSFWGMVRNKSGPDARKLYKTMADEWLEMTLKEGKKQDAKRID